MSIPSSSSSSQARPTPVTLVSGYEITHNASNGYERHFRSCTALRLQASWAALNKPHDGVHTFNMAGHDEVKAMERQWKKVAAIRIAAEHALKRDSESLIIWHDGDALPHPRGEAIERARRIAAEQPDVDVWVGPGDQKLLAFLPKLSSRQSNDDFYGVPIDDVLESGHHLHLHPSIALHTGVILVRAKAADAALYEAVRLYYDYEYATQGEKQLANFMVANRSLPLRFCCGGEQGPLNYHLLTSTFRNRTRMVPWLLRDVDITSCDTDFIYPTRHPSFIHFSGCTAKTSSGKSRAHLCVPLVCREDEEGIEVATEEPSDAWVSRYELRLSQMFVGTPKTAQLKSELPSPVSAESLLSRASHNSTRLILEKKRHASNNATSLLPWGCDTIPRDERSIAAKSGKLWINGEHLTEHARCVCGYQDIKENGESTGGTLLLSTSRDG